MGTKLSLCVLTNCKLQRIYFVTPPVNLVWNVIWVYFRIYIIYKGWYQIIVVENCLQFLRKSWYDMINEWKKVVNAKMIFDILSTGEFTFPLCTCLFRQNVIFTCDWHVQRSWHFVSESALICPEKAKQDLESLDPIKLMGSHYVTRFGLEKDRQISCVTLMQLR